MVKLPTCWQSAPLVVANRLRPSASDAALAGFSREATSAPLRTEPRRPRRRRPSASALEPYDRRVDVDVHFLRSSRGVRRTLHKKYCAFGGCIGQWFEGAAGRYRAYSRATERLFSRSLPPRSFHETQITSYREIVGLKI